MRVWLVTVGEPLPINPEDRLLRTGILARMLARQGHEVTWWTSNFDHFRKRFHLPGAADGAIEPEAGLTLRLLPGSGYQRNVSIARLIDHRKVARAFARQAAREKRPDIILCSFPTIELSVAATEYGERERVPVVLDVRDLWPDIFLELAPKPLRPLARAVLAPLFRATRRAFGSATAVTGNTRAFVEWGLRQAGREAGPLDRDFPFGYSTEPPAAADLLRSEEWWRTLGVSRERFVVCFFGTMARQFELEPVIEAARDLAEPAPEMLFVLCGDGERLPALRERARDRPNVLLPGRVGHAEIWALMRMSAAGLAPYVSEKSFTLSLPNKVIEYLSAGLPVVSCLRGAVAQLIEAHECGLSYGNRDVSGLVAALTRLYRDPGLRRKLSGNAAALFDRQFVAETVYGELMAHLETVRTRHASTPTVQSG